MAPFSYPSLCLPLPLPCSSFIGWKCTMPFNHMACIPLNALPTLDSLWVPYLCSLSPIYRYQHHYRHHLHLNFISCKRLICIAKRAPEYSIQKKPTIYSRFFLKKQGSAKMLFFKAFSLDFYAALN
eukprot:c17431_g1_i1 orf=292-669(-)